MTVVVLDSNAIIVHGRAFPDRVREAVDDERTIVVPRSVKRELVDDVLEDDDAPANHRASARAIQKLVDEGVLDVRTPDFTTYADRIDEARRRLADGSVPEHSIKADQYIPALVCELAEDEQVQLVTGDRKLRSVVREMARQERVEENVVLEDPSTVL